MSQTARYQETLRRLATIDEGFVEDEAGLGWGLRARARKSANGRTHVNALCQVHAGHRSSRTVF